MRILYPFLILILSLFQVQAQNCLFEFEDNEILCFADPSLQDGGTITATCAEYESDDFINGLVIIKNITDCDDDAGVVIRRRFTDAIRSASRSRADCSKEVVFEVNADPTTLCFGKSLTLNIEISDFGTCASCPGAMVSEIPSMSEWGLLIFCLLLLNLGLILIARKEALVA